MRALPASVLGKGARTAERGAPGRVNRDVTGTAPLGLEMRVIGWRYRSGRPTGTLIRPLRPLDTPAAEVYQATKAVMMPR
jgi:hypothetical protein